MNLLQIVVGILLFAAATMVLYLWGLRRSVTQQRDLERAPAGQMCCTGGAPPEKAGNNHPERDRP